MAEKEVSMSIDETNRLRASLGLKPLSDKPAAAEQTAAAAPKKAPEGPSKEELLARVTESREKRRREAELRSTKTLGASGDDVDDLAAWAARVKPQSAADAAGLNPAAADGKVAGGAGGSSRPSKRQKRGGGKAAAAADGEEADDDEGGDGHTAADLAGVKVRHDLENLTEGEAVVLTLADTGILDERGELADGPDTLENALVAEQAARSKARGAATKKAKPLWEEDGKVRGLLDKYDEEEEDAMAAFDAGGALALSERQKQRQAELSSKLAAGAAALLGDGDGGVLGAGAAAGSAGGGDYMTADEAAAAKGGGGGEKKKKRKSRKLRTTKVAEEEEGGGGAGGGLDLDALEAAAAAEAAAAGGGDLGSRSAREQRRREQEEAKAAAAAERTARFEAALSKANVASEQLRPSVAAAAAAAGEGGMSGGLFDDDADDELAASLARARRVAQKGTDAAAAGEGGAAVGEGGAGAATANGRGGGGGITSSSSSLAGIARELAIKREQEEEELKRQIASGGAEAFSETAEFVRSIQPLGPKAEDAAGATYMDVDEQQQPAAAAGDASVAAAAAGAGGGGDVDMLPPPAADSKPPLPPKQQRKYRKGGWVSAAEGDEANGDADGAGGSSRGRQRPAPELEDTGVVGERAMGKGLAATLGLIKDKGMLRDTTVWAGRNNDKKPVALIGLEDVYTGGAHEDAMQQRIETALTQRDEFGRVMTPKERFRVMCHQFHGKPPSKNKQEQRQRKYLEEVAVARATSSENPSAELDKMKELQRQTGSAYIPLTGKFKPSSNTAAFGAADDDQPSGFASARTATAATPMLGGGLTPLSGNKKVEMMLGISKAGAGGGGDGAGSMAPPAPRR